MYRTHKRYSRERCHTRHQPNTCWSPLEGMLPEEWRARGEQCQRRTCPLRPCASSFRGTQEPLYAQPTGVKRTRLVCIIVQNPWQTRSLPINGFHPAYTETKSKPEIAKQQIVILVQQNVIPLCVRSRDSGTHLDIPVRNAQIAEILHCRAQLKSLSPQYRIQWAMTVRRMSSILVFPPSLFFAVVTE